MGFTWKVIINFLARFEGSRMKLLLNLSQESSGKHIPTGFISDVVQVTKVIQLGRCLVASLASVVLLSFAQVGSRTCSGCEIARVHMMHENSMMIMMPRCFAPRQPFGNSTCESLPGLLRPFTRPLAPAETPGLCTTLCAGAWPSQGEGRNAGSETIA